MADIIETVIEYSYIGIFLLLIAVNAAPILMPPTWIILSSFYEGLPNVLLEAISLKKFIISSNCPTGPSEILLNGKAGFLFNDGDHVKLSNFIIYYYKNKKTL